MLRFKMAHKFRVISKFLILSLLISCPFMICAKGLKDLKHAGIVIEKQKKGMHFILPDHIVFLPGHDAVITKSYYPSLRHIARILQHYPDNAIAIEAFSDSGIPLYFRKQATLPFAKAVANFLVEAGIDPDRIIEVTTRGSDNPRYREENTSARHANRRVEIILLNANFKT